MKINEVTPEKFKEDFDKGLNGIYVFILNDCSLCTDHLENLEKGKLIEEINLINCLEDINYFWKEQGLDDMPETRVYKDGNIVFSKGGVFYDKQQRELKEESK